MKMSSTHPRSLIIDIVFFKEYNFIFGKLHFFYKRLQALKNHNKDICQRIDQTMYFFGILC